jgi:hypothetical protein
MQMHARTSTAVFGWRQARHSRTAAKESSWDAHCSIDVQLLCGAGLEETAAYLTADGSPAAAAALEYLRQCEASGDFAGFSAENQSRWYSRYYSG